VFLTVLTASASEELTRNHIKEWVDSIKLPHFRSNFEKLPLYILWESATTLVHFFFCNVH
jgi:hypothetical protein